MKERYLVELNGEEKGPYSLVQLREMWRTGIVAANTLCMKEGDAEWGNIEALEEKFNGNDRGAGSDSSSSSPPPLPPWLGAPLRTKSTIKVAPPAMLCRYCKGEISKDAQKCRHCGELAGQAVPSDALAGCLGLFLGPVGLWYKGLWGAGFAWFTMILIVTISTGGFGILLAPIFWLGMTIHALLAKPKG